MTTNSPFLTKVCSVCSEEKTLDHFRADNRKTGSDRTRAACRACEESKRRDRVISKYNLIYDKIRDGCVECGEKDIRVLQFDHLDRSTKSHTVSRLLAGGFSYDRIEKEIEKCRVMCANCHHKHTAEQMGHYSHIYMMSRLNEKREETE